MEYSVDFNRIRFGSTVVRAPYTIDYYEVLDDVAVVVLNSFFVNKKDDRDFDIESDARNVLGFDSDRTIRWMIPEAPQEATGGSDDNSYQRVFAIDDNLYAKTYSGYLFKVDPSTGGIIDSWPFDQLPLGGSTIQLAGEIQKIIDAGDRVFVRCRESDVTLYAFDKAGNELWRSEDRRGMIYLVNGELCERVEHGPRRANWYRINQDTGERIEKIDKPL